MLVRLYRTRMCTVNDHVTVQYKTLYFNASETVQLKNLYVNANVTLQYKCQYNWTVQGFVLYASLIVQYKNVYGKR